MAKFQARKIPGRWRDGYALDLHTLSSTPIGHDAFGHMQFDTTYSEVGGLLYRLKSKGDRKVVTEIVGAAEKFIRSWNPPIEAIVPVPPSSQRPLQPVMVLAKELGRRLGLPLVDCLKKTREARQLKNVSDFDERLRLLKGLHKVDRSATRGKRILLFDDLYRSGATMNAITDALYDEGEATDVFALAITRTRSHR
ncbi:MAG: phosphoribosyltransferase family protein [Candidatus Binataceae bacterium]